MSHQDGNKIGRHQSRRFKSAYFSRNERRRESPEHNSNPKRGKGDYRIFMKPSGSRKRRTFSPNLEDQPEHDQARVSLPLKTTRFGNIFGNMRLSDRVRKDKGTNASSKRVARADTFRPNSSKLCEPLQRYLQEPSLVSFGSAKEVDDLAWMEEDSTADGGVSERLPISQPHSRSKPTPRHERRSPSERSDIRDKRMISRPTSPIASSPERQSPVRRPHVKAKRLVSRATSPILSIVSMGSSPSKEIPEERLNTDEDPVTLALERSRPASKSASNVLRFGATQAELTPSSKYFDQPLFQQNVCDEDPVTLALSRSRVRSTATPRAPSHIWNRFQPDPELFVPYSSPPFFAAQPAVRDKNDVESILAEYRYIRESMQSRMSGPTLHMPPPNDQTSPRLQETESQSGRRSSATRVYPRRMF